MKRLVPLALLALLLAGCTANDPLASQYSDGSGQGYISGDGAYAEIPVDQRADAVEFSGPSDQGATITNDDFAGQVYVVNFWYAGCPPCRIEAPDLAALSTEYDQVPFLGVNILDDSDTANTFEKKFEIGYPSIVDIGTGSVQLAFASSGAIAPNAVPTTLVIDREGRVAARISGLIKDKSILAAMLDTVLAE